LVEETLGPWKTEQGLSGIQLGKGTIESGKPSDDTNPGYVPVQRTQLRS